MKRRINYQITFTKQIWKMYGRRKKKNIWIKTVVSFLYNKTNQMHQFLKFTPALNSTCFRAVPLPIIRSLFTVHSSLVYVIQTTFEQDQDGTAVPSWSCSKAVFKPVWHIPVPSVQWINSWWWAEELPETCKVSCRRKFGKLVHLVGFVIKKFVTMHGHMSRYTVTWT